MPHPSHPEFPPLPTIARILASMALSISALGGVLLNPLGRHANLIPTYPVGILKYD
jgi:hypothetical protein